MKTASTKPDYIERLFKETGLRISTIQDILEDGRQEELIREERRYKLAVCGYRSVGRRGLDWLLQDKKKRPSYRFIKWLDHSEGWIVKGRRELHAHPYHMSSEDLKDIIRECEENNLVCRVDTYSDYAPGYSLRIILEKQRGDER